MRLLGITLKLYVLLNMAFLLANSDNPGKLPHSSAKGLFCNSDFVFL